MAIIKREMPKPKAVDAQGAGSEQYEELARLAQEKREERRKQVLTLRVSNETMAKARALGKGYTGILSRLLEEALDDPEMIRRCL